MQIIIMRHGQASFEGRSDAERELTEQGRLEARLMASWMEKMQYSPDLVWVSPFIRAQQTYQGVLTKLDIEKHLHTMEMITPSGDAKSVRNLIDGEIESSQCQQLLIISHMPFVSYLVGELTQQQSAPIFQTAGVCEIAYNPEKMLGEVVRMVSPIDLC